MGFFNINSENEIIEKLKKQLADYERRFQEFSSLPNDMQKLKSDYTSLEAAYKEQHEANTKIREEFAALMQKYSKLEETYREECQRHTSADTPVKETREEPTSVEEKPAEPETTKGSPASDFSPILKELEAIKKYVDDSTHKDELIRSLHKEVQTLSQDIFSQLTRPYLNGVIRIYNHLAGTTEKAKSDFNEKGLAEDEKLYKKMEASLLMVQDMLEDEFDASFYAPAPGDAYDPRLHYAVQSIPTDDEKLAGTVKSCRQGGFRKSETGKVLKQAVVVVYCLNKK